MRPVSLIAGAVTVLDRANVDTDQIVPKQFMKRIERRGYADALFYNWAREPGWSLPPNPILVTGGNFGCGSSREHAVWALQDYGFEAVVASSLAYMFASNCTKVGIVPVVLPDADVRALMKATTAEVDLTTLEVRFEGRAVGFELDETRRRRMLRGIDDVGATLEREAAIEAYEAARSSAFPAAPLTTDLRA